MDRKKEEKLLKSIEKRSNDLIELPACDVQTTNSKQLEKFITTMVPKNTNVESEFHREFAIGEKKSRIRPRKCLKTGNKAAPNRGKKRMTSLEKRKRGLLKLSKRDKTFGMFIPIHKMWIDYAKESLNLQGMSTNKDSTVCYESMQLKIRKLEMVGSLIKVTRSLCSGYIGIEGIVIEETKNTFTIVNIKDEVKIIPKAHSEFAFMVEEFCFTILGNHICQRPVNKAKQSFSKHVLWL